MKVKGKIAVITGASSGIGEAIARRFAKVGSEVVLLARRQKKLEKIKAEIEGDGGKAHVFSVDLRDLKAIERTFARIKKEIGDADILVNNAGCGGYGPAEEIAPEEFARTFDLNVRAVFFCTRQVLPAMKNKQEGTIINISSQAGLRGLANATLYCASKFAVTGYSQSLLEEVRGSNVRVSYICPGFVNTEFFGDTPPKGTFDDYIQPDDVAEAALLCASDTQNATFKEIIVRPRRPVPGSDS